MTDDEIMYRAFLAEYKVLKQCRSKYYVMIEKILKLYKNCMFTEYQLEMISPEWLKIAVEIQKGQNIERFIRAILATSDDRFARAKRLNPGLIRQAKELKSKK